ncbi:MAG: hypothetical protein MZV64_25170 [Ignavibacteriales bacterium]|nr:hypothetical protein [Ignavibacteriales bacterium]
MRDSQRGLSAVSRRAEIESIQDLLRHLGATGSPTSWRSRTWPPRRSPG